MIEKNQSRLMKLGRLLSTSQKKKETRKRFLQAGFHDIPYRKIGAGFIVTIVLTLVWYVYVIVTSGILAYGIFFVIATFFLLVTVFEAILLFASWVLFRLYLEVKSYARMQEIEQNLPLFLREFATNLKAGREFLDALEDSFTPQLGALNEDLQRIVVDIKSGMITEKVLKEYSQRYDSYAINDTFEIIIESYNGGGGLAEIIDKIAENLEVIHYLKKNAIASVSNYVIFTSIVSLFIAPLLFALSYNLLFLISSLLDRLIVTGSGPSFLNLAARLDISFSDFIMFSRAGILVISGSAASIIGIIRKGSLRGAPVLVFIFILISLLMYEAAFMLLNKLFMSLFQLA